MTESEHSAERLTPQNILGQYMALSPTVGIGQIETSTLYGWRESLHGAEQLDPEEQLLAAWVEVEFAFACQFSCSEAVEPLHPAELFGGAVEQFRAVAEHPSPQVNGLMRGQAMVAQGAARVLSAIVSDKKIDAPFCDYIRLQTRAARHVLAHGATTGSARAAMWADSLALVMLSSQEKGDLMFPCSPRHVSPDIDGFYRHNALVIESSTGRMNAVRVGNDGPPGFILVPPAVLGNDEFPSQSGYGTLEAIIQQQDQLDMGADGRGNTAENERRLARIQKTLAHSNKVTARFLSCVAKAKQNLSATVETASEPLEWYRTLPPGRQPFIVSSETLDAAISPFELRLAQDGLTPSEAMELAWLYVEVALGRAALPASRAINIRGDIERAEEVFAGAMERLGTTEDSLAFCEASFGFASLAIYESVLCGDGLTPEQAGIYCETLAVIGRRAAARYDMLPDKKSAEALGIDQFMQRITVCLLAALEGGGSYAALGATPRQRGQNGWDISIWSETHEGFVAGRYGRLRVTEKEDPSTLADGVVTVTPQHLNQKVQGKRFVTFMALADEFQNVPPHAKTPASQRRKQIVRAWQGTVRAIEAAEV